MSGGATGDRRGAAAGSKGVGSGTATGKSGSGRLPFCLVVWWQKF